MLSENIKNCIGREIGLSFQQIQDIDLSELEKVLKQKRGGSTNSQRAYRKSRDVYIAMGKILTEEKYEENIIKLIKRYT
jgi:hypothetical protein